MQFLKGLFGSTPLPALAPGRGWVVPIVGEAQCQHPLQAIYRKHGDAGHDIRVDAALIPENDNRVHPSAVRIEIDSPRVGYLARELAQQYRTELGDNAGQCSAKIVGGFELDNRSSAFWREAEPCMAAAREMT